MSDDLHVHTTLSATDHASPIVAKFLAQIREFERVAKRLNSQFINLGGNSFGKLSAQLQKSTEEISKSADKYKSDWDAAYRARLNDARRMHAEIGRLERQAVASHAHHQRAVERA